MSTIIKTNSGSCAMLSFVPPPCILFANFFVSDKLINTTFIQSALIFLQILRKLIRRLSFITRPPPFPKSSVRSPSLKTNEIEQSRELYPTGLSSMLICPSMLVSGLMMILTGYLSRRNLYVNPFSAQTFSNFFSWASN